MTDMSKPYDGGPAFPVETTSTPWATGLTKRQWLAGMALANTYTADELDPDKIAELAVQVADSILAVTE